MRLIEMHIKNLKGLNSVELRLPNPLNGRSRDNQANVVLLYGDNGVGKTTVLEAVSLLGHISTMTRVLTKKSESPQLETSFLRDKESNPIDPPWSKANFDELARDLATTDLESWWKHIPIDPLAAGRGPAAIRYVVQRGRISFVCYTWFRQSGGTSVTEALSRQRSDDGDLDNQFAVLYDHDNQKQVVDLIKHMYEVSPHYYKTIGAPASHKSRELVRKDASEIVAYWNTDLNDFGKKNDLRESVKKLRVDSRTELVDRLSLSLYNHEKQEYRPVAEIDDDEHDLVNLNKSLGEVIADRALLLDRRSQGRAMFQILKMKIGTDPVEIRVTKSVPQSGAQSGRSLPAIDIDHMSAGENESFFIFLLLHGMPIQHSIVLLDEPDLHLSEYSKERFFHELYKIAAANDIQLIVSTHSAFAYVPKQGVSRKLLDRLVGVTPEGASVTFRTEWSKQYGRLLAISYFRYTGNALSATGPVGRCLGWLIMSWSNLALRRVKNLRIFWGATLLIIVLSFLSISSFLSDLFTFSIKPDLNLHGKLIEIIVPVIILVAATVIMLEMLTRDTDAE